MDDLERLLGDHRADLRAQEHLDAKRGWRQLRSQLEQRRSVARIRRLRWGLTVAAGLLLLVAASWWWSATNAPVPSGPLLVSDYAPELYGEERGYLTAIEEKQAALHLERIDSSLFAPFLDELRLIDSLQRTDLAGLPQVGVNDRSLRALIRYYQTKLQLLQLLENELLQQHEYRQRPTDRPL